MPKRETMIRCRLLELMGRRGIRFISRLAEATGVNRRTLSVLAENRMARFDADVLERLCAFFDCQPGDLLERCSGEAALEPEPERKAGRPPLRKEPPQVVRA
jgi:putative transcriptional regulator